VKLSEPSWYCDYVAELIVSEEQYKIPGGGLRLRQKSWKGLSVNCADGLRGLIEAFHMFAGIQLEASEL
jgi:hypothetical protein